MLGKDSVYMNIGIEIDGAASVQETCLFVLISSVAEEAGRNRLELYD